jgi:hypothetical protein
MISSRWISEGGREREAMFGPRTYLIRVYVLDRGAWGTG